MHGIDKGLASVKTDESDFASLTDILQREQHAGSRGFVGSEDSLYLISEAIEKILGSALGRVARSSRILVG